MLSEFEPGILLVTRDRTVQAAFEPVLAATGAHVEVVDSGERALEHTGATPPPALVLLDSKLPNAGIDQLLAAARSTPCPHAYSIVLLSDSVSSEWHRRLAERVLDDLIPRSTANPHWRLRLDVVLSQCHRLVEFDRLREALQMAGQYDTLLGVYNRSAMLCTLFRETDRAQRMKTPLGLLLFEVDDFDHWQARLDEKACDALLRAMVDRATRLLRSYDTFGRVGSQQFLAILPGCSSINSTILAERIRMEVFSPPFASNGEAFRLSACFGIASSQGRSPTVVLREAEMALERAQAAGPESILCFTNGPAPQLDPVEFLSR